VIWPDGLKKFDPVTVTLCPAEPVDGSTVESAGGPLGGAGGVEVGVDEDVAVLTPDEPPVDAVLGLVG
jgi:hypothetical protein